MNELTSNQLNDCNLDDSFKTHQFDETSCVVDEKFVPKAGMIFKTLEEAGKFYNTTRDGDKIKNQLITNPSAGLNCPARIYVHIMKDVGLWTISKFVLNHSHLYCPNQAEMLKQHRELSINPFVQKFWLSEVTNPFKIDNRVFKPRVVFSRNCRECVLGFWIKVKGPSLSLGKVGVIGT
ncbi:hypothetical protein AHAS_Ahas02G0179200 [Arachis hypogaea]